MTSQQAADIMLDEHRANKTTLYRIAEIDAKFDSATFWGSWMVEMSIERRNLVNSLAARGWNVPHRHTTNVKLD